MATRFYLGDPKYNMKDSGLPIPDLYGATQLVTSIHNSDRTVLGLERVRPVASAEIWVTQAFSTNSASYPIDGVMSGLEYVSEKLDSQSISGTFKGQIKAYQNTGSANAMTQVQVFLISESGEYKSTLYSGYTGDTLVDEFPTFNTASARNRPIPYGGSTPLTPQTATAGDRLLIRVGVRVYSTLPANYQSYLAVRSTAETDLPEDNTTATSLQPWFEFSQDLLFVTDEQPRDPLDTFNEVLENYLEVPISDIEYSYTPIAWTESSDSGGTPAVPTKGQIWPRF